MSPIETKHSSQHFTENSSKGLGMEVTNAAVPEPHSSLPLQLATGNEVWTRRVAVHGFSYQVGLVILPVSLPFERTGA